MGVDHRPWQLALVSFEAMFAQQLQPNVIPHNAAISAYEKGRNWLQSLAFLSRFRRQHHVKPDAVSYFAAITACGACSQSKHSVGMLSHMRRFVHALAARLASK